MTLQYLQLEIHQGVTHYQLYFSYLVDDDNLTTRSADILLESSNIEDILDYLIDLLRRNIWSFIDFEVDLGNHSKFDLVMDTWTFLNDIEELVKEYELTDSTRLEYIDRYKRLVNQIIEVEMQAKLDNIELSKYRSILITAFDEYGFNLFVEEKYVDFKCLESRSNHDGQLIIQFLHGIFSSSSTDFFPFWIIWIS